MFNTTAMAPLNSRQMPNQPLEGLLHSKGTAKEKNLVVAKEFESLFLNQLLQGFDKTVNREDDILGGGEEEQMYRGLLYQELSRAMAYSGGIGISDMVAAELDRQSEGEQG